MNLILFILTLVVGVLRLFSGNLIGALIPLAIAVYCGSIAFDYPTARRLKQLGGLLFRRRRKKK
ncbi:MAG: hypothetical protein KAI47_26480 [Deltaproteobacteria bacterium]|nr:hypothetical protein [Deltaproteobacteria bacterium]